MTEDDHNQPPKTIAEVGIHVGYLREDIKDIKTLLKDLQGGVVLKTEFEKFKEDHEEEHATMWKAINKKPILSTVLWALFGSILTAVTVYEITSILGGK